MHKAPVLCRLEIVRIVSVHNVMDWVMFGDNSSFLEMIDSFA